MDRELRQKLCDLWGKNVKNYVVEKEGILGKEWEWKDWRVDSLSEGQQQSLTEIFSRRNVCIINREDRISWCATTFGKFSVKRGYEIIDNNEEVCFEGGDLCWNKEILPKTGTFSWLAIQGIILTGDRRRKSDF